MVSFLQNRAVSLFVTRAFTMPSRCLAHGWCSLMLFPAIPEDLSISPSGSVSLGVICFTALWFSGNSKDCLFLVDWPFYQYLMLFSVYNYLSLLSLGCSGSPGLPLSLLWCHPYRNWVGPLLTAESCPWHVVSTGPTRRGFLHLQGLKSRLPM